MIDSNGLHEGDTLILYDMADLGKPKEAMRLAGIIEAIGATIELRPIQKPPKPPRAVWLSPNEKQHDELCTLWYSSVGPSAALNSAEHIMGRKVLRGQLDRLCGPRDGSDKKPYKG